MEQLKNYISWYNHFRIKNDIVQINTDWWHQHCKALFVEPVVDGDMDYHLIDMHLRVMFGASKYIQFLHQNENEKTAPILKWYKDLQEYHIYEWYKYPNTSTN